jgi:hypothetical protein
VIGPAGSIYTSSKLLLSARFSIACGAKVVGADSSGVMTGRCYTTVGGGGLEEVHLGQSDRP